MRLWRSTCMKVGAAGNLLAPVGNLPTRMASGVALKTSARIVHRRGTRSVRQVAGRNRLVACPTQNGFFKQALSRISTLAAPLVLLAVPALTHWPSTLLGAQQLVVDSNALLLFEAQQPQGIQLAALTALDRLSPSGLAAVLLGRWSSLTPAVRDKVVEVLLKRPDRASGLFSAMEEGTVQRHDLSLMQIVALRQHTDPTLQQRAIKLIGARSDDKRDEVVRRFLSAIDLRGDYHRGKAIFLQRCQSCHRFGSDGFAVGPDLAGTRNGGKDKLLVNILDPNREVAPNYFAYVVDTQEGDSYTGIIVNETASSVTIRQPLGNEVVVPRSRIAKIQTQSTSLMPEGLEEGLTNQDLADLLDFLVSDVH